MENINNLGFSPSSRLIRDIIKLGADFLSLNNKNLDLDLDFNYESRVLLADVLDKDLSYLYSHSDKFLTDLELDKFFKFINLRAIGTPVAYIIGKCCFWDLDLLISKDVLVPRADTEILIEQVLQYYPDKNKNLNILDLGTGSGAIGLSLASEYKNANITATDISIKALDIAKKNAIKNNINNINFLSGKWYEAVDLDNNFLNKFDIICSNPPYIDSKDTDICKSVKEFEPNIALFSEDNGLSDIKIIINQASKYLKQEGLVFVEHGYSQANNVREIFNQSGFVNVNTAKDLAGKDRVSLGMVETGLLR